MKKILCVIDAQNDFITGSLRNEEAIKVVPNIVKKINEFDGNVIYVTMDTHDTNYLETDEGKKLPVTHCVKYTNGWLVEPSIKEALDNAKARGVHIEYIEKPTFGSYDLADRLFIDAMHSNLLINAIHSNQVTIDYVGFCTDICVVSNVLLAKAKLYDTATINVYADCCAGVTPESHKAALMTMQMCQINIINE